MTWAFLPCPYDLNFFCNCLFLWYEIAPTLNGITVEDSQLWFTSSRKVISSQEVPLCQPRSYPAPREKLEHLKNLHLWSVHLVVPCFLHAFDDRVLQVPYFSLPGTIMVEGQCHATSSHLDNGICGQDLWRKFEELMKDFSQSQVKADPPNTAVDTGRKEEVTDRKARRWGLSPETPPVLPKPRNATWIWRFKLAGKKKKSQVWLGLLSRSSVSSSLYAFQCLVSALLAPLVPSKGACQPETYHLLLSRGFPLSYPCLISMMFPRNLIVS